MSIHRSVPLALLALASTLACAPAERSTDPSPAELPFHSGNLSGATSGRIGATQTTSSPGVTLTGLTGSFTRLSYQPPFAGNRPAPVYFTALSANGALHLWRVNTDGTGLQELTSDTTERTNPSIAPSGKRVLFWQLEAREPIIARTWLAELLPDNSIRQLLLETNGFTPPMWSPDEKSVVYSQTIFDRNRVARIVRVNLETLARETLYQDSVGNIVDATMAQVHGVPLVIYQDGAVFYQLDLTTGTKSVYLTSPDSLSTLVAPRLSHDGSRFMYWAGVLDINHLPLRAELKVGEVDHPESAQTLMERGDDVAAQLFDARWLVDDSGFVARIPSNPLGIAQLYLLNSRGSVIRQLTELPGGVDRGFTVGPAGGDPVRVLIGEEGVLGGSASGIIFGQDSSGGISSVVSFLSSRPRSVVLKAETGLNSSAPVLTYTLRADRIETLRFITDPANGAVVTVVDSTMPPVGGAVITFDAATGKVAAILPFAAGVRAPGDIAQTAAN